MCQECKPFTKKERELLKRTDNICEAVNIIYDERKNAEIRYDMAIDTHLNKLDPGDRRGKKADTTTIHKKRKGGPV